MNLTISGHHLDVTPALRTYVTSKLDRITRHFDQVVVNHGTVPMDDLYFELKPFSRNLGAVDYDALLAGRPQARADHPEGAFQLFRVGDAVSARNTHAAIYDALRLCKDF